MRKWLEKGKQLLKRLEDDFDSKKETKKDSNSGRNSKTSSTSDPISCGSGSNHEEDSATQSMMSRSLEDEKLHEIGQLLLNSVSLSESQADLLRFSPFFKAQPIYNSVNAQLRKCEHEIDFASPSLQQLLSPACEQQFTEKNPPLVLIGVVGFHHKLGSIVEFNYPETMPSFTAQSQQFIKDSLPNYCMPDAIHNKNEDYVYFTLNVELEKDQTCEKQETEGGEGNKESNDSNSYYNKKVMLFGVSYFKQVKVSDTMRSKNSSLTRSHMQKSVFVLSSVPLQGYIMGRLEPTTKAYFDQEDLNDCEILKCAFEGMNQALINNKTIQESEIYIGTSLKTSIFFFKEKTLAVLKALMLGKKILVYSLHSCATSNFLTSLLSLIPGLAFFKFKSRIIDAIQAGLNEYGLPLRLFSEECPLVMQATIQDLDKIQNYKGYLLATTNQLLKQHKKTSPDVIVDLDANNIIVTNDITKNAIALNADEKKFMEFINKTVVKTITETDKNWKNMEYSQNSSSSFIGSNDWIRQQFSHYLVTLLSEIELVKKRYREFGEEISRKLELKKKHDHGNTSKKNKEQQQQAFKGLQQNNSEEQHAHLESQDQVQSDGKAGQESILNLHQKEHNKESIENKTQKSSKQDSQSDAAKASNEEQLLNELFDDLTNFDSDSDDDSSQESSSYQNKSRSKSDTKFVRLSQLDGDALMGIGFEQQVDRTQQLFKQRKSQLKISYAALKKYNLKFLKEFFLTNTYKYWLDHHDESIALRSVNSTEINNRASLSLETGAIYFGTIQAGERHGKGTTYDPIIGRVEQCESYQNDQKNGHTTILSTSKEDYFFEGEYISDMRQGFGNLVMGKKKYSGYFVNDKQSGQGSLVDKDGSVYEGDFSNNSKDGMGKWRSGDNSITYVGQFREDEFEGKGQLVSSNGDVYCGEFKRGKKHGQGELMTNLFTYNGELKYDKLHGQGIYKNLETNDIFQGEFLDGELDSTQPCIIKYSNGDVYSGPIKNWFPEGEGLISYKDGSLAQGLFVHGQVVQNINK